MKTLTNLLQSSFDSEEDESCLCLFFFFFFAFLLFFSFFFFLLSRLNMKDTVSRCLFICSSPYIPLDERLYIVKEVIK